MALSPSQSLFYLELVRNAIMLLQIAPELKANFQKSTEKMEQFIREGRDPTEEELAEIKQHNDALFEQLQS